MKSSCLSRCAFLTALIFSGCTSIGHVSAPADWPELVVEERHVPHKVMRDVCGKYAPVGMSPEACTEVFFGEGRCVLWFSADFPPSRAIVEHEHLHCAGHDHVGGTVLADHWAAYKAARTSASAGR